MKKLNLISLVVVLVIASIFTGAACGEEKKEYTLETQWEDGTFILGLTLDSRIFLETENGGITGTDYNPAEIEQLELETKTLYPGEEVYPEGYTGPLTEIYGWGRLGEGIDEATVTVTVDPPQVITIIIIRAPASPPPTCPAGMISYWKFDEGSGTTAFDSTDANNGTIYGATWTTGKVDGALSFDGVNDYVRVPYSSNLSIIGDKLTMEAWVYFRGAGANGGLIFKKTVGYGSYNWDWVQYGLYTLEGVDNVFQTEILVGQRFFSSDYVLNNNQWYHVAATYDGQHVKIYVNGTLVKSISQTGTIGEGVDFPLDIGGCPSPWTGYSNATIDEVAVCNRALSHSEIQQHYLKGLAGKDYCA